ncbi:Uma2 family endonuclease [Tautonia plasticadhaerens]|uniref:Putative restriction endonuclease domain-containing protein n=1 Tax=Tautonia plasticadhaerens TaxID=2527974 RepID=A0A518GY28_9BACT|nr:Uma2 family endonuclease [Tautonia plasticadhaerens]QDV33506.1 hypothetical protein ElP_13790 [Tautonia plasticadhaerens]
MSTIQDEEIEIEIEVGPDVPPEGDMVITLQVGDGGLDRYLELVGDRNGPRIKCLDGSLTIVSPSFRHERGGERLNDFIGVVCEELDIDFLAARSTLLRPPGKKNDDIEPDSCDYIQHEAAARDAGDQLDLARIPPPDLLVEVVVTHGPSKSLDICLLFGVPEVWLHHPRTGRIQFLILQGGRYVGRTRSRCFPFLAPADLLPWLTSPEDEPDNRWRRRLRDWVREVLAPRRGGEG